MTAAEHQPSSFASAGSFSSASPAVEANHVYIIDDDRLTRRSLSFALSTAGYDVRAFISGRDFLDDAESLVSGCVLLDVRMPELDGIAVLKEMGDRIRRFPVVMITGHGDVDVAVQAMKLGAIDFLEKPFQDKDLLSILEGIFSSLPATARAEEERVQAVARVAELTPRERQLLHTLMTGVPNKVAARQLGISVRTIEMHRRNLMQCLKVSSFVEAIRLAILAGVRQD